MKINEVTKEVSATFDGLHFRFKASGARLAEFEAQCDDVPFAQAWLKSVGGHAGTTIKGLVALCVDGPSEQLGEIAFSTDMIKTLTAAIETALPEAVLDDDEDGESEGNAEAARAE